MGLLEKIKIAFRRGRVVICAAVCASAVLAAGAASVKYVTISADGETYRIVTTSSRPEKILKEAGVEMGAYDEYTVTTEEVGNRTGINVKRAVPITLEIGGASREIMTGKESVGDLIDEFGLNREKYRTDAEEETPISEGMKLRIMTHDDYAKEQAALREERLLAEERARGTYVETSRGALRYTDRIVMEASAYLPTDGNGMGITATGIEARHGVVAVDPDVIPLGTRVYVPGYGVAVAADTGGMIQGYMIDLCMEDYNDAIQFGRRDIDVYILDQ